MNKVGRFIGAASALALGAALVVPMATSWSDPVRETITVPAGNTTFSIPITVDEATAYSGIEFQITVSPAGAATLDSFTPSLCAGCNSPSFVGPRTGPPGPTLAAGQYVFGFWDTTPFVNSFAAGSNVVGTLDFINYDRRMITFQEKRRFTHCHFPFHRIIKSNIFPFPIS